MWVCGRRANGEIWPDSTWTVNGYDAPTVCVVSFAASKCRDSVGCAALTTRGIDNYRPTSSPPRSRRTYDIILPLTERNNTFAAGPPAGRNPQLLSFRFSFQPAMSFIPCRGGFDPNAPRPGRAAANVACLSIRRRKRGKLAAWGVPGLPPLYSCMRRQSRCGPSGEIAPLSAPERQDTGLPMHSPS